MGRAERRDHHGVVGSHRPPNSGVAVALRTAEADSDDDLAAGLRRVDCGLARCAAHHDRKAGDGVRAGRVAARVGLQADASDAGGADADACRPSGASEKHARARFFWLCVCSLLNAKRITGISYLTWLDSISLAMAEYIIKPKFISVF